MLETVWKQCLDYLEGEIPQLDFETFIRPLQPVAKGDELRLLAPNQYVRDHVAEHYSERMHRTLAAVRDGPPCRLTVAIGSLPLPDGWKPPPTSSRPAEEEAHVAGLSPDFTFPNFVEGRANQIARAAALQVAEQPGIDCNPLLFYGGTGLGKTHLMHAIGNHIAQQPNARVACISVKAFVGDMVRAIRHHRMDRFNQYYRSMNALLIDDIQFIAGKEKSQEEFFHIFDDLLQSEHQVVMTCDVYPREIDELPDRLKSRFASGVSIAIDPPDMETRAAILKSKATLANVTLSDDVALLLADRIRSNVRELEGALRNLIMSANIKGEPITEAFCREVLQDLFSVHARSVPIEKILKEVADYHSIRVSDLTSKSRKRSIVKPRHMAMALARELTSRSFPEIGEALGGRDHTTVIHGCRKAENMRNEDSHFDSDFQNLLRRLST